MASLRVALFVEDLAMFPDPVNPGQEVRFRAKLRNDGAPLRANIKIQDPIEWMQQENFVQDPLVGH